METCEGPAAEYVAFDLETTGLSAESDRIVEVGAVRFDASGEILGEFERLVNPLRPSGARARAVHGISDAELALAETAEVVLPEFLAFLGDPVRTTLLAHNASFDAGFLGRELARLGRPMPGHAVVDTLALARRRWPKLGSHKLDSWPAGSGSTPTVRTGLWPTAGGSGGSGWPSRRRPTATISPWPTRSSTPDVPSPRRRGGVGSRRRSAATRSVRIEYAGGTRGPALRAITPRRFSNRGGVAYLVALCHLDLKEKEFRLDRVRSFEVIEKPASC